MPHRGSSFVILKQVDSTNNYAMGKVHAGLASHGDAWFSSNQTGGKGQRGKGWHTGDAENIALSIVIEPAALAISQQFMLSVAVALGCFDFFSSYAGNETSIKWPNDIYWRDRKAGGVLIENLIGTGRPAEAALNREKSWKFAVVGIGLNINQPTFDEQLPNAVSLRQITGASFDVIALGKELKKEVLHRINQLETEPHERLLNAYNNCLFKLNQAVKLKKGSIEFDTIIKGVKENGQLYTVDRVDNFFNFGEVEWLL